VSFINLDLLITAGLAGGFVLRRARAAKLTPHDAGLRGRRLGRDAATVEPVTPGGKRLHLSGRTKPRSLQRNMPIRQPTN